MTGREVHEGWYNPESDTSLHLKVVQEVAEAAGLEPLELPPLAESIDPDALDALFRHHSLPGSLQVSFTHNEQRIRILSSGRILVGETGTEMN